MFVQQQARPNDKALEQYLLINDRAVNYGKILNNKEWNLFLFKKTCKQPYNISIDLTTYDMNEVSAIR